MKSKVIGTIIAGIIIIILAGYFISNDQPNKEENTIFQVTLADPELYENGAYLDNFDAEVGTYEFRFVPNGDSPKTLSISINGDSFQFEEDFVLDGTPHDTGISTYYTWDYLGQKTFEVKEMQDLEIVINPNGNEVGSVSVEILH